MESCLCADAPAALQEIAGRRWIFRINVPFGLDLHWLRELQPGHLLGESAIRTGVQGVVEVEAALDGALRVDVGPGLSGRTRVRIHRAFPESSDAPAIRAEVRAARPSAPLAFGACSLLDALIGAHLADWVRDALRLVGGAHWRQVAGRADAGAGTMMRLFEQWRLMTSSQEAALLECAADPAALGTLGAILGRLEEEDFGPGDLTRVLNRAVEEDPDEALSPWAAVLECCGAAPPFCAQTEETMAALRAASAPLRRILGDAPVAALLAALPSLGREELTAGPASPWFAARLKDHGAAPGDGTLRAALAGLAGRIFGAVPAAFAAGLPARWAALIASADPRLPLVDASLPCGEEGRRRLERLSGGDLGALLEGGGVERHSGLLAHLPGTAHHLALRIPFLLRREVRRVSTLLGSAAVRASGDGVIEVHLEKSAAGCGRPARSSPAAGILKAAFRVKGGTPEDDLDFIQFTDRRRMRAGATPHHWRQALEPFGIRAPAALTGDSTVTLTVKLAARHFTGWTRTPHSRDPEFIAVFARISRALQSATRDWLPLMYLWEPANCRPALAAASMLAYQHTQVYALRRRGEFGYDALDPADVGRALETARRSFPQALSALRRRLLAEAGERAAAAFEPERANLLFESIRRREDWFTGLLIADNRLLEEMLQFGECCRELRATAVRDPRAALRKMAGFIPGFVRAFEGRLDRLYNGAGFASLAPLLLIEATRALPPGGRLPVDARLTIETSSGARTWTEVL
jgi:hypothetical protein